MDSWGTVGVQLGGNWGTVGGQLGDNYGTIAVSIHQSSQRRSAMWSCPLTPRVTDTARHGYRVSRLPRVTVSMCHGSHCHVLLAQAMKTRRRRREGEWGGRRRGAKRCEWANSSRELTPASADQERNGQGSRRRRKEESDGAGTGRPREGGEKSTHELLGQRRAQEKRAEERETEKGRRKGRGEEEAEVGKGSGNGEQEVGRGVEVEAVVVAVVAFAVAVNQNGPGDRAQWLRSLSRP